MTWRSLQFPSWNLFALTSVQVFVSLFSSSMQFWISFNKVLIFSEHRNRPVQQHLSSHDVTLGLQNTRFWKQRAATELRRLFYLEMSKPYFKGEQSFLHATYYYLGYKHKKPQGLSQQHQTLSNIHTICFRHILQCSNRTKPKSFAIKPYKTREIIKNMSHTVWLNNIQIDWFNLLLYSHDEWNEGRSPLIRDGWSPSWERHRKYF